MTINWKPLSVFAALALAVCGLAAFGERLGMSPSALHWCQAVAGMLGAFVLSHLPGIFSFVEQQISPPSNPRAGFVSVEELGFVFFVSVMLLSVAAWPGCGASLSDGQRQAYAAEVERCERNEAAIVARTGSTYADDQRDLEAERARCDAARRAIEVNPVDGGR